MLNPPLNEFARTLGKIRLPVNREMSTGGLPGAARTVYGDKNPRPEEAALFGALRKGAERLPSAHGVVGVMVSKKDFESQIIQYPLAQTYIKGPF